jgi:hypothetical protein
VCGGRTYTLSTPTVEGSTFVGRFNTPCAFFGIAIGATLFMSRMTGIKRCSIAFPKTIHVESMSQWQAPVPGRVISASDVPSADATPGTYNV